MLMIDCKKVKLGISGSRIENLAEFAYLTTELIKKYGEEAVQAAIQAAIEVSREEDN